MKFHHLLKKIETATQQRRRKLTSVFGLGGATPSKRRPMEDIPPEELNSLLAQFFIKVRKFNGDEFEPGTLTSLQRSFDRFLRQHGKNYSIIQDKIFEKSQNESN